MCYFVGAICEISLLQREKGDREVVDEVFCIGFSPHEIGIHRNVINHGRGAMSSRFVGVSPHKI